MMCPEISELFIYSIRFPYAPFWASQWRRGGLIISCGGDDGFLKRMAFLQKLHHLLKAGQNRAICRSRPLLVSITEPIDPLQPLVLFHEAQDQERIVWEQPSQGFAMVAIGVAKQEVGWAKSRFDQLGLAYRQLVTESLIETPSAFPWSSPMIFCGFSFDPAHPSHPAWQDFPDALFILPRFLFVFSGKAAWLTVNILVTPRCDIMTIAQKTGHDLDNFLSPNQPMSSEDPVSLQYQDTPLQKSRWKEVVNRALQEIQRGTIAKLVLAREVYAHSTQPFHPGLVLWRLHKSYQNCTIFAFVRGKSCFLGATPERLVRLQGRTVEVNGLAGSIARGMTEEEDRLLGNTLLTSSKDQHEHRVVVRTLQEALEPVCASLTIPQHPTLLLLPNVQHLLTSIQGILKQELDILHLVERLHPTPALGGVPREAALSLIRTYERWGRGWYAAPIGWMDGQGSGEFVVAIRSALLQGKEARLYTGCGIVHGSDPEREYEESCLKLQPMLWALNNGKLNDRR